MIPIRHVCRFCQCEMSHLSTFPRGGPKGEILHSFYCIPCKSEQLFEENGESANYSFVVGDYTLMFWSNYVNVEKIKFKGDGGLFKFSGGDLVFKINFIPPNFTPQTVTEERIKTLILFS